MALPGGTDYDLFTLTNPGSALTDFTLLIDLSNCSADFKSNWNTDSNGYGRAAIHGSGTELACDWIDLDYSSGTGLLRVKWSGTFASSGTQQLRLYPPNTGNSQYSSSDTYGSDNAYKSAVYGHYPLSSDGNDRSSNSRNLTAQNGLTFGGQTGHIGDATIFDDSSSEYAEYTGAAFDFTSAFTISMLVKSDDVTQDNAIIGCTTSNHVQVWIDNYTTDRGAVYNYLSVDYGTTDPGTNWTGITLTSNGSNDIKLYVNGSSEAGMAENFDQNTEDLLIGSCGLTKYMSGLIQQIMITTGQESAAWVAYEYAQLNDNSTMIGSGTWQGSGATGNPHYYYENQMGGAA